jgi:hypothetical protein
MPGEPTPTIEPPPALAPVIRHQRGAGPARLAGDILWLGISTLAFAFIIGIVCWPLSAELSPRMLVGAAPGGSTPGVPGTGGGYATLPPIYSANRIALSGTSLTKADEVGEGSSGGVSTTSIAAPTTLRDVKLPLDVMADPAPNPTPSSDGGLALARPRPKPARSASAAPAAHQPGPRPQQRHQQARPEAAEERSELVPR